MNQHHLDLLEPASSLNRLPAVDRRTRYAPTAKLQTPAPRRQAAGGGGGGAGTAARRKERGGGGVRPFAPDRGNNTCSAPLAASPAVSTIQGQYHDARACVNAPILRGPRVYEQHAHMCANSALPVSPHNSPLSKENLPVVCVRASTISPAALSSRPSLLLPRLPFFALKTRSSDACMPAKEPGAPAADLSQPRLRVGGPGDAPGRRSIARGKLGFV